MENRFTKGEWITTSSAYFNDYQNIWEKPLRVNDFNFGIISGKTKEETEANSKLIVCAPDMLDALKYIIESISPEEACRGKFKTLGEGSAYVGVKSMPTDEAILRCIEIIKKATGMEYK